MFIRQMLPTPSAARTQGVAAVPPSAPPPPPGPMRPGDLAARAQKSALNNAYNHLLTAETLAALLALNEDGTIKLDDQGGPQLKNPGAATADGWFRFGLARAELRPPTDSGMTADDAAFLGHMTGCTRVEMGGGLFTLMGAGGQPEPLESPAWQLASLIPAHRAAGYLKGKITSDWFMPWAESCAHSGVLAADWRARARDWFGGESEA